MFFLAGLILLALAVRILGMFGKIFNIPPANTTGIVVMRRASTAIGTSGGEIVDLIHGIPGHRIDRSDPDKMNWKVVTGDEERSLLYYLTGTHYVGVLNTMMNTIVRTYRSVVSKPKEKGDTKTVSINKTQYEIQLKENIGPFQYFKGQHDLEVPAVETAGAYALDYLFNVLWMETYPIRARLFVADAYAQLTNMVKARAISFTLGKDPVYIFSEDSDADDKKKDFEASLSEYMNHNDFIKVVEGATGITIISIQLQDIGLTAEDQKLFQKERRAQIEAKAKIAEADGTAQSEIKIAEGKAKAKRLLNEADEDYLKRVVLPAAEVPGAVQIRVAEANRDAFIGNKTVTVFAPGGTIAPLISTPDKKSKIDFEVQEKRTEK